MSIIAPDGWYDLAKRLPKGLNGALEPGGREDGNGIIPTNFHGLDFEVVSEFDLIVEHESCEERDIGEDGTGITRFLVYLTSNLDGSARARFVDDGETHYLHFRAGTDDGGLGEGYDDLVEAIRAALERL